MRNLDRELRIEQMCRQGMKYADIAEKVGMSENAVKIAVLRAGLVGVAKAVRRENFVAMAAEYYRNYGRVTLKELAASFGVNPKTLAAHVYRYRKEALEMLRKEAAL